MARPSFHTRQFTPEALLEIPRRSHAIANASGTLAVYTQHTTSLRSRTEKREIRIFETGTPRYWPVTDSLKAAFPQWLGNSDELIWLETMPNGHTQLVVASAYRNSEAYIAGVVPGPVRYLRVTKALFSEENDDDLAFAFIGQANPDGTLYNPFEANAALPMSDCSTEWSPKNVIWFGRLIRPSGAPGARYAITDITNLMAYFNLGAVEVQDVPDDSQEECREFAISSIYILFTAKDLDVDPSTQTACSCYICPMFTWEQCPPVDEYNHAFQYRGLGGRISSPSVNPDGTIVFLSQKNDGYAADKNRIILVTNMHKGEFRELFASENERGNWDLSPSAVTYTSRGLLIQAEEKGQSVLYALSRKNWPTNPSPSDLGRVGGLHHSGSVMQVTEFATSSRILVSCDNFHHGRELIITDMSPPDNECHGISLILSLPDVHIRMTQNATGLSATQIEETWFSGAEDRRIHAWIIKPSTFNPDTKYPLAYCIHDGPHSSWIRHWAKRTWNLALLAEQGYVVVAPNITGSTGYGQDLTDATRLSFGGAPLLDLGYGLDYISAQIKYVDTSRAVALGRGYGGYLVNWMQSQSGEFSLAQRFRALITDNGMFNLTSQLASLAQHPIFHEMGGAAPWDGTEEWARWDPARHLQKENWRTPHLIIHGKLNSQYPVSDGLATFKILQLKNTESDLLLFEDEGHDVCKNENVLLWYRTVIDWMERFTKDTERS